MDAAIKEKIDSLVQEVSNISDLPTGYYLMRIDNRRAVKFIKENK